MCSSDLTGSGDGAPTGPRLRGHVGHGVGQRVRLHVEERKRVYAEIQKIAMDQALILPLWDGSWITLAAPAVQALRFDQIASPLFYNAWVQ